MPQDSGQNLKLGESIQVQNVEISKMKMIEIREILKIVNSEMLKN